jgi:hypothetical protein
MNTGIDDVGQKGVSFSKLMLLIRKNSKSDFYYDVAKVYFEIKAGLITASDGLNRLKFVLVENSILVDIATLDLKHNNQIKLQNKSRLGGQDSDFFQQADDVLATAGINPDEESSFLIRLQHNVSHFSVKDSVFKMHKEYFRVRHVIASRAKENVLLHSEKAEWVMNEALRSHLKTIILSLAAYSKQRRLGFQQVFTTCIRSKYSPKALVRFTNTKKETEKQTRDEAERQVLLKVGEAMTKRKDNDGGYSSMERKVAKVLQQEEDRIQAQAANQATRTAFGGDAKYLKWQNKIPDKESIVSQNSADSKNTNKIQDQIPFSNFSPDISNNRICLRDLLLLFKQNNKKMAKSYHGFPSME